MMRETIFAAVCLSLLPAFAGAQQALPITTPASTTPTPAPPFRAVDISTDSGLIVNDTPDLRVIYTEEIRVPKAEWIRLEFGEVLLSGQPDTINESLLIITSLQDGAVQYLNARHVVEWQHTSAYFNGDAVRVEILSAPGTGPSRVEILSAAAGELDDGIDTRSICGTVDDRQLSSFARDARYFPLGCTAWIIGDRCMISAGHCVASPGVIQFNVPFSTAGGGTVNPPPEDQYAVDPASMQSTAGGIGNDWAYFGVFDNSNTGLSPFDAQGDMYQLASAAPAVNGQTIRITGYGTTSSPVDPTWNQVQKTHTGPYVSNSGTTLLYAVDTTGGNSGSAVLDESTGLAIGIHTNAGCNTVGGNQASAIHTAGLQAALADPQGVCRFADCNNNGINDYDEISQGTAGDCNNDGVLDECEIASGVAQDCNNNGVPDLCDITPPGLMLTDAEPAAIGWLEISGTGTALGLSDDGEATVSMGFSNPVFGSSSITIGNNGGIGFVAGADLAYTNAPLPSTTAFGGAQALLVLWDDIDADTGNVYYQTIGSAPNQTFVVEWKDRPHFSGNATLDGDEVTFQIQVFESPIGGVHAQMLYKDTDFQNVAYNDGASATVGYQAGDGTAQQWSFNAAVVDSSVTLSLTPAGSATSQDLNGNGIPDECESLACSEADLTTQGAGAGDPGFGVPDGLITAADINFYVNAWFGGDLAIADLTTQGAGAGDPGFGVPDGLITAADINFYVNLWGAGCP